MWPLVATWVLSGTSACWQASVPHKLLGVMIVDDCLLHVHVCPHLAVRQFSLRAMNLSDVCIVWHIPRNSMFIVWR